MNSMVPGTAVLSAIFALAGPASAAEIHVNPGESFETAAESLQAGDTLIVHAGTYTHSGRLEISAKGSAQQPVIISGADGEAKPQIVLTAAGQNVVNIAGASWLTMRNLEITANGIGGADGVNLSSSPSNVVLEGLTIHDISVGINFRSSMSNITARRNHIYNTNDTGEGMYVGCHDGGCAVSNSLIEYNWIHDTTNADQGDGIEIKRGSHSNIIRDNVIHDTRYPCIILYGTDGNPRNIVERNVVWNCADAAIQVAADTVVRNNIFIPGSGRGIASQSHAGVSPGNLEFVHNTIIGGNPCVYTSGWSNKPGMVFANNAVYCSSGNYSFNGLDGVAVSGNVFEPMPSAVSAGANSTGRSEAQDFIDAGERNTYPTADSALLSAGDSNHVTADDFNGTARIAGIDAGAYAWTGATNPGWAVTPGFKDSSAAGPTVTLAADPTAVGYQGQSTLNWSSTNANACEASGDWTGARQTTGQETVGPLTQNRSYTLTCSNAAGDTVSDTVSVTVGNNAPPPTLSLDAASTSIAMNASTTLTWSSGNADGCVASGAWDGDKAASGSESTGTLTGDATFTLECSGAGGAISRSVTVTVQPDGNPGNDGGSGSGGGAPSWFLLTLLALLAPRGLRRSRLIA